MSKVIYAPWEIVDGDPRENMYVKGVHGDTARVIMDARAYNVVVTIGDVPDVDGRAMAEALVELVNNSGFKRHDLRDRLLKVLKNPRLAAVKDVAELIEELER